MAADDWGPPVHAEAHPDDWGSPVHHGAPPPAASASAAPLDDIAHAAGPGTIARASLAPDPQVQIKRYAESFNQPVSDFGIVGDHIVRRVPDTGEYARVEPSVRGATGPIDAAERAFRWVAGWAGPAIPAVASGLAAVGAGALTAPTGPGALAAASAASAAGAAGGEVARQKLDAALAKPGEEAPMDWGNVGWQAAAGLTGPAVGKVAGKVAGAAGKGILAEADRYVAPEIAAAGGTPAAPVAEAANPTSFGLSPRVVDALKAHIAGREEELAALRADAQALGVDLSLGQVTGSTAVQQAERQLARTPEGADQVAALRRGQNEEQIPGAVRKVLDDVAPDAPAGQQVDKFRGAADAVVQKYNDDRAAAAAPIYAAAFKANQSVDSPEINRILETPSGRDAFKYAITRMQNRLANVAVPDPELTAALKEAQELGLTMEQSPGGVAGGLKLQTLDYVKQALGDQEALLRKQVANGTARQGELTDATALRRAFTKALDAADVTARAGPNSTKAEGGLYAQARRAFGDASDDVDSVVNGGVGFLNRMSGPDRQNMVNRVFSGQNLMPDDVTAMRRQFAYAGKLNEWNGAVRSYVADKLADALTPTQGGELSNVGGKMYRALWGDQRQADIMRAALGGNADDALMARWDKLGGVLRAAAHQLPEGAPTATDTGSPGLVRGAFQGAKAILSGSPSEALKTGADVLDGMAKLKDPDNARKLAGYLLTPEGDKLLKSLYPTTPGTPKANSILATMLTQAGVTGAEGEAARSSR